MNQVGQYGNGTTAISNIPVNTGILNPIKLSGGGSSTVSLSSDNKLYSWGNNDQGQLGNGTNTSSTTPVAVDMTGVLLGKTISQISCGNLFTIVSTSDNKLYSWGDGGYSQLGNGSNDNKNIPVAVDMTGVLLGKTISQISCGDYFTLVSTSDNKLYSWGMAATVN